jgi:hypothetical protein
MQYKHLKLQRSVTLIRRTLTAEIDRGPVSKWLDAAAEGVGDGSITGKRMLGILATVSTRRE